MINKIIDNTLNISLILILGSMTCIVAANVFCRFVLGFSIYWGDELAQVLMVWLTFLGAAAAIRDNSHYTFSFLVDKLSGIFLKIYILTRDILILFSIAILGFYSFKVTLGISTWVLPALEISRAYVYMSAPLGCLFMLYYALGQFMTDLNRSYQEVTE